MGRCDEGQGWLALCETTHVFKLLVLIGGGDSDADEGGGLSSTVLRVQRAMLSAGRGFFRVKHRLASFLTAQCRV